MPNLVIVESPAKAKTIEKILGKEFVVSSSYGHVRDLPEGSISVDVENAFEPQYEVSDEKKKVVKELKKLAKGAETVYLATDEDREGEAISWHLCHVLGLDPATAKRITYTEVTDRAIKQAIENPRHINLNLVNAQQARRILDRLVGYKLSPVLWKKVKPSLSAGRVQSVAVRLIVEREREILNFQVTNFFKLSANFDIEENGRPATLKAECNHKFSSEADANELLQHCASAAFTIKQVEKKPAKKSPSKPFTTSTLQQEASRKLGYSVAKTMMVAQKLYEAGLITYMRTDSLNLSETAIEAAKEVISSKYGEEYSNPRRYKTKNSGAQEAHEAIRPTDMANAGAGGTNDEQKLYDLIWKRTLASQMADAKIERTVVHIDISGRSEEFQAKGEVLLFDGFLKVYRDSYDTDDEDTSGLIPPLSTGQELNYQNITAIERFTKSPARYAEATLVRKLEELGIGRPSTYAPTISTVQKRNYVKKQSKEGTRREYAVLSLEGKEITKAIDSEITGAEKAKLFPTDIGLIVNDFLVEHFNNILDYHFTANIEKEFDEIANGDVVWNEMIDTFYQPFHEDIETTTKEAKKATGERALGDHPESGEPIIARMGRYGPMVQVGHRDAEEKPRFAKLREGQSITTISLEEALELFNLPRKLGEFEGLEVEVNIGRFGPYVRHDGKFASLKKEFDPYTVDFDTCVQVIKDKREADKNKFINVFEDEGIQVLNGAYGPYLKKGRSNFKIPKDTDPKKLTAEECVKLIEEAIAKKGTGKGRGKSKAKTKTKAKAKPKGKKSA